MNSQRAGRLASSTGMFRKPIAVATIAILALGAMGCFWLGAGSLAYNYEKTGSITGIPSSSAQSSSKRTNKSPNAQPTPSNSDIE